MAKNVRYKKSYAEQIIKYRKKGYSKKKIATLFKIAPSTLLNWSKKYPEIKDALDGKQKEKKKSKKNPGRNADGTFTTGNKFWNLRSKHGRDKLFASPKLFWEACCEYFQWCEDNPLYEAVIHQKTAKLLKLPKMRPFTLEGLASYLGADRAYMTIFKSTLEKKVDRGEATEIESDFLKVCVRVYDVIYRQKYEGASSGFLNPTIVARDLGLTDRQRHEHSIDKAGDFFEGLAGELNRKTQK